EQLIGPRVRQGLRGVPAAQRRIGRAIGDIRPESTLLDGHRLAGDVVVPQTLERRLRGSAAATLRLRVDATRLVQRDGEQLLLAAQGARVRTLLQVRAIAAVLRGDDLPI